MTTPEEPYRHLPTVIKQRIAIVGVCASGKTMLTEALRRRGFDANCCAQEHSYVPDMWQRFLHPEVLIYLDASWEAVRARREVDYGPDYLDEQRLRLAHAREHCTLYLDTSRLTEEEVVARVLAHLSARGIAPRV